MQNAKYWNFKCRMSREKLSDVLYATLMCGGEIPSTYAGVNPKQYSRRQNAQNMALLKIKLPEDEKKEWEDIVGDELEEPPEISV